MQQRSAAKLAQLACAAAGLIICTASPAAPVSPSQVTPPSFRPAVPRPGEVTLPGPTAAQVTDEVANVRVTVGNAVLEGVFGSCAAEARERAARARGQRLSIGQLYELAASVEQIYANAGYVLARVGIPPQQLNEHGTLRLVVVDGFIESIDASQVPSQVREAVRKRTAGLIGLRGLKLAELERRLLLAGEVPGLTLKSTLIRGEQTGGARLILEGTHQRFSASVGLTNRLPESLQDWQLGASASADGNLGLGEQVYGSLAGSVEGGWVFADPRRLGAWGTGLVLPLGVDGLSFNPEWTAAETTPTLPADVPATQGFFERLALRANYPLIKSRRGALDFTVSAERLRQHEEARDFDVDLSRDDYWVSRFGARFDARLADTLALAGAVTLSQGLGGRDEGDAALDGVPLSRDGSDPVFSKVDVGLRARTPVAMGMALDLHALAQHAFGRPLLRAEQFQLDGAEALSAFPNGAFSVDAGVTLRGELSRPFRLLIRGQPWEFNPYVFGASGCGWLLQPTAVESGTVTAQAWGLGLRSALRPVTGRHNPQADAALELARGITGEDIADARSWRVNLQVNIAF